MSHSCREGLKHAQEKPADAPGWAEICFPCAPLLDAFTAETSVATVAG
jgi:hypothetical protein